MTTDTEDGLDAEAPAGDDAYAAQHARLMEGLAASIREKGLAQTQVSDIVRHAHASRRTFYKHFEDKEACFVELMNTLSDAFLEEVDRAIDREAPIATQIEQAIDTYLSLLRRDGAFVMVGLPPGPLPVQAESLVNFRLSFAGSSIGGIRETQEMLDFCAEHRIGAEIEVISGAQIDRAWDRVVDSSVRYRFVIDTSTF